MESFEFKPITNSFTNESIKPKICFACVCKNEEKCILIALESVYKFIDYWVICDTGSTDNTCELITTFFKNKGIDGELFYEPWKDFGHNKTLLFKKCSDKYSGGNPGSSYILHFDADDYFVGNLSFIPGKTQYFINVKKKDILYPCLLLFDAAFTWRFCGVAHTTIKCLDNPEPTVGYLTDKEYYMYSTPDTGARAMDPKKYLKDAEKLKQQFFDTLIDDPDDLNSRSIFYTAQSYRDQGEHLEAIKWYSLFTKIKDTWIEELYISFIELGVLYKNIGFDARKIEESFLSAINIIPDRAEAYYQLGLHYNQTRNHKISYTVLRQAKDILLSNVKKKYILFINERNYEKYLNDELSVACYWLEKYTEGKLYLLEILHDPDFEYCRQRLLENENHFKNKLT